MKEELKVHYKLIGDEVSGFLSASTDEFNESMFRILKLAYLPVFLGKAHQDP